MVDEDKRKITITGFGGRIPKNEAEIDVGSAGTAARFLTALLGLSKGRYHIVSSEQMKKRPMKDLLVSLESWELILSMMRTNIIFLLPSEIQGNMLILLI